MKQLNKEQEKERQTLVETLRSKQENLENAIGVYNEAHDKLKPAVEDALNEYNEALSAVGDWRDTVLSDMDAYLCDRSEKWQESEAASAYQEWKSEYEDLELDPVELEFPDPPELPDLSHSDAIDSLSRNPA